MHLWGWGKQSAQLKLFAKKPLTLVCRHQIEEQASESSERLQRFKLAFNGINWNEKLNLQRSRLWC